MVLVVKNPPANAGDIKDSVRSLGREDPLEEEMENHSSICAGRIPWTQEPGRLYSSLGCKELDMTEHLSTKYTYVFGCARS